MSGWNTWKTPMGKINHWDRGMDMMICTEVIEIDGAPRRVVAFVIYGGETHIKIEGMWDTSKAAKAEREAAGIMIPKLTPAGRKAAIAAFTEAIAKYVTWDKQMQRLGKHYAEKLRMQSRHIQRATDEHKNPKTRADELRKELFELENLPAAEQERLTFEAIADFLNSKPTKDEFVLASELTHFNLSRYEHMRAKVDPWVADSPTALRDLVRDVTINV